MYKIVSISILKFIRYCDDTREDQVVRVGFSYLKELGKPKHRERRTQTYKEAREVLH